PIVAACLQFYSNDLYGDYGSHLFQIHDLEVSGALNSLLRIDLIGDKYRVRIILRLPAFCLVQFTHDLDVRGYAGHSPHEQSADANKEYEKCARRFSRRCGSVFSDHKFG